MLWFYLAFATAIIWAFVNVIDKIVISDYIKRPVNYMIISGIFGLLSSLALLLFVNISVPAFEVLALMFVLAFFNFAGIFLYLKSFKLEEVSKAMLIFRVHPVFVLILAFIFLSETLTFQQYAGFFVILAGVLLISLKKSEKFFLSKGLVLMVFAVVFFAVFDILLKYVLSMTDFWNAFFWFRIFYFIIAFVFILPEFGENIRRLTANKRIFLIVSASETASIFAYLLFIIALSLGSVSLISVIGATQPVFVFLIAAGLSVFRPDILKEELDKKSILRKIISVIIIIAGTVLLI